MWKHSANIHGVSSPKVSDTIVLDDVLKIIYEEPIREGPIGGLFS
jgi:hypothetical protein